MLKVSSGVYRGKKLYSPAEDSDIRPTSGLVKSAIFNILCEDIRGSSVLELFCGTGQLSIEALSRGAERACLVDSSRVSIELAQKNISAVSLGDRARLVCASAENFLARCTEKFDIVFMDPPYSQDFSKLSGFISNVLRENGIVVYETDTDSAEDYGLSKLQFVKRKAYGRRCITLYKK